MSKIEKQINDQEQVSQQVKVASTGQYIKAISFEVTQTRKEMRENTNKDFEPQFEYQIALKKEQISDHEYELILDISVNCNNKKDSNTNLFSLKLEYAGLFIVESVPNEEILEEILMTHCASLIFPFARSEIALITMGAGFSPTLMDPIDFRQMYASYKKQSESVH